MNKKNFTSFLLSFTIPPPPIVTKELDTSVAGGTCVYGHKAAGLIPGHLC